MEGGTVAATVRVVERLGPAVQLLCEIEGISFHVLAPSGIVLEPGATIHPQVRSNAAVVWPDGVALRPLSSNGGASSLPADGQTA